MNHITHPTPTTKLLACLTELFHPLRLPLSQQLLPQLLQLQPLLAQQLQALLSLLGAARRDLQPSAASQRCSGRGNDYPGGRLELEELWLSWWWLLCHSIEFARDCWGCNGFGANPISLVLTIQETVSPGLSAPGRLDGEARS